VIARVAANDPLAHSPFRPAGEAPFGVIGDGETDDVAGLFTRAFARIEDHLTDVRDRLERLLDRFF